MGRIKNLNRVRWNLKRALIERRMLAVDLADMIGVSRAYLTHVIVGRYPGYPYRKRIAEILGYPVWWLFEQGGNGGEDRKDY